MRHRVKFGKIASFTPEKMKMENDGLENREIAVEFEGFFEVDTALDYGCNGIL